MFAKVVVKRGKIVFNKNAESTSKGWILLFYRVDSKTGSTRGDFTCKLGLFLIKPSIGNNHYWSNCLRWFILNPVYWFSILNLNHLSNLMAYSRQL